MRKWKIGLLAFSLLFLLSDERGCGGDDDQPEPPQYQESEESKRLKALLGTRTEALAGTTYEDWLKRFTPETSPLMTGALEKYQGLLGEKYGLEDYTKTEQDYLDTVLRKYGEARTEAFKPMQESLIAESLFGSGPGYDIMGKFGKETATGVGDITKQWAYEGIQRKQQQIQYQDALKRGDYTTMYNLALSEETRKMQPVLQATQAEFGALSPAMQFSGQMSQEDLAKYQAAMNAYNSEMQAWQENQGSFGGLGAGLGMLAGGLLAIPTGGMSIPVGAAIGGAVGGGAGSLWRF